MGLFSFLFIFSLGFISPFLLIAFVFQYVLRDVSTESSNEQDSSIKAGEIEEKHQSGLESFKNGWLFVTNEYIESTDEINRNTTSITESVESRSAISSLYKLVNREQQQQQQQQQQRRKQDQLTEETEPDASETKDDTSISDAASISSQHTNTTQQSSLHPPPPAISTQSPPAQVRQSLKKHRYFGVLKHGNLFLYKDQTVKDVKHVIVLGNYFVSIWPRNLPEPSLFTKYTAIALINVNRLTNLNQQSNKAPSGSFFIYCDTNSDKEDWYFALIRGTKLESSNTSSSIPPSLSPQKHAQTLHFSTKEMVNLIQALYSSEGHLQTKWMNALIGRWFLAIKDTKFFENYIFTKLSKKLNKIKKPGFFDEFQITNIQPGHSAPFFTYPSLKEINPDGTLVISSHVSYNGGLSVTIATKLDLTFGTKFTTREVDLVLKISLVNLEGPMLIKLKPPPSNRFWYCYEVEPTLNFQIEPILSSKSLNYSFITSTIEKKFKEAVKESLVMPYWDDIEFYKTEHELYRGGIWKHDGDEDEDSLGTDEAMANTAAADDDASEMNTIDETASIQLTESDFKSNSKKSLRRMGSTINDFTKKIKNKSNSPSLDEFPSTGGTTSSASTRTSSMSRNPTSADANGTGAGNGLLKRIGKWYFKDDYRNNTSNPSVDKTPTLKPSSPKSPVIGSPSATESYHPPEMISNRRTRKSPSVSSFNKDRYSSNGSGKTTGAASTASAASPGTTAATTASTDPVTVQSTLTQPTLSLSSPKVRSPSFNFARTEYINEPPALPTTVAAGEDSGSLTPKRHYKSTSGVTAGQLASSSAFAQTLNNMPNSPSMEQMASGGGGGGVGAGIFANEHDESQADSGMMFAGNNATGGADHDKNDDISMLLSAEPTVALSQPSSPNRSRTVRKKPPPSDDSDGDTS
ncbi:hypothetical protein CANMA_000115 [Candida margitis]|uniref:uncharacterized protein n=1 Tax=Candida margitis TaxID=1775924 RepID=UPI0022264CFA|nr:uncharacterized protein CANMA_000115 [Candida margitis]KAI5970827.1 hypothetical protein CANMA_000115 [Candida margitis]